MIDTNKEMNDMESMDMESMNEMILYMNERYQDYLSRYNDRELKCGGALNFTEYVVAFQAETLNKQLFDIAYEISESTFSKKKNISN